MAYALSNQHSTEFLFRKTGRKAAKPFAQFRRFMRETDRHIRTSEERDFGFFVDRGIAPERSASVFA